MLILYRLDVTENQLNFGILRRNKASVCCVIRPRLPCSRSRVLKQAKPASVMVG